MSREPLAPHAVDGTPLSDEESAMIEAAWESRSDIEHLPFVHCQYVGDNDAAIKYLLHEYRTSTTLRAIYDTHVRLTSHQYVSYSSGTMQSLRDEVTALLNRYPQIHLFEILGHGFDDSYIENLSTLFAAFGHKRYTLRKLHGNSPLMNFILLEHQDAEDDEVLFGWGRYAPQGQEAVFRSKHPLMVRKFRQLYDTLLDDAVSSDVSPQALRSPMLPPPLIERLRALEAYRSFAHHYFVTKDRKGKEVWIYAHLRFELNQTDGTLTAVAATVPEPGEDRNSNMYEFKAELDRTNLVITTRRIDITSGDIGIELFPHADAFPRRLDGMRMVASTFAGHPASSIAIISKVALVPNAIDGEPLQNPGTLQADWEALTHIDRLPLNMNSKPI